MKNENLDELIEVYAHNKKEMEDYKKICDKENAQIKSLMSDMGVTDYNSGKYCAVYSVSKRETINEEMMLEIAHHYGIPEIVKVKEYIDYDALENAIYKGLIEREVILEMDKARNVKEIVSLRITENKQGEK